MSRKRFERTESELGGSVFGGIIAGLITTGILQSLHAPAGMADAISWLIGIAVFVIVLIYAPRINIKSDS